MSELRPPDDIRKGDWVLNTHTNATHRVDSVWAADSASDSGVVYRILVPGDVVPAGSVLLWVAPGQSCHMSEHDFCGDYVVHEYGTVFALKSLPEPEPESSGLSARNERAAIVKWLRVEVEMSWLAKLIEQGEHHE